MAQHHDLGVLRRLPAAQQEQPTKDPDDGEVQKSDRHSPRSCLITVSRPNRRSQPRRRVLEQYRLIADTSVAEFIARAARDTVRARTTSPDALAALLRRPGVTVSPGGDGELTVTGLSTDQVGTAARTAGITLLELTAQHASLEEAFTDMTRDAVEFRAPATAAQKRRPR
jgi:hypothetical protein